MSEGGFAEFHAETIRGDQQCPPFLNGRGRVDDGGAGEKVFRHVCCDKKNFLPLRGVPSDVLQVFL